MVEFNPGLRFILLASLLTIPAASAFGAGPRVFNNARHDTSLPLTQLASRGRMPSKQADREMAEPRATRACCRADAPILSRRRSQRRSMA